MRIPKGNALIEQVALPYEDVNAMFANLEQENFSGYVSVGFEGGEGVFLFQEGRILNPMELSGGRIQVCPVSRIANKCQGEERLTSSYVLAPDMVSVLASSFAFSTLHQDVRVRAGDWTKLLKGMEEEGQTGLVEFRAGDRIGVLLVDRGKVVMDNFNDQYGQVMCGTDSIAKLFDEAGAQGALVSIYGEQAVVIEQKRREAHEALNRFKQLIVKSESGWFKGGEALKIDEHILREWGHKPGTIIPVEVETSSGALCAIKCTGGKRLGGYLAAAPAALKKFGLSEGEVVTVRPVRE